MYSVQIIRFPLLWRRSDQLNQYFFVWILVYMYIFVYFSFVTSNLLFQMKIHSFHAHQWHLALCMCFCYLSLWKEVGRSAYVCTYWGTGTQLHLTLFGEFHIKLYGYSQPFHWHEDTFCNAKIFRDSLIWVVIHLLYIKKYLRLNTKKILNDKLIMNSILSLNFISHVPNYLH